MSRVHVGHRMRETSLEAYGELPQLGNMQRRVLESIIGFNLSNEYPTDREVVRDLKMSDPNRVRPRRNELMEAGVVVEVGKKVCPVTGKKALTWKIAEEYRGRV